MIAPFGKLQSNRELFDAGIGGVRVLLKATNSPANASPQDRMIDLIAGTGAADDAIANSDAHNQVIQEAIRIFEAQKAGFSGTRCLTWPTTWTASAGVKS